MLRGSDSNGGIEVRGEAGGIPYIDFANDATVDYDARIKLTGDDALTIEGTNVGIGITSPADKLTQTGNIRMRSADSRIIGLNNENAYQLPVSGGGRLSDSLHLGLVMK